MKDRREETRQTSLTVQAQRSMCSHLCIVEDTDSWVIVMHGNQSPNAKKMTSVFLLYDIKVMMM